MAAAVVTTLPLNEQAIGTNDEIEVHLVIAEPAQEVAFIQAMPEQIYASDEKPSATKPKSRPTTASEEPMTPTTAVAALPEPSIQQPTSSTPAFTPDRDPEDFAAGLSPSFVSLALSYRPPSAARTIGSVEYCGQSEPRIEVEGVEEEQVVDAVPAEAEAVPPIEQVVVQPIEQPVVREEHEQIQPGLPDGTQDDAAAAFFGGSVVDFISPPQPMQTIEEPAPPAERPFAVDRNSQLDLEAVVFDSAKDEQQNEAANEHQAEEQIEDGEDDYMSEAGFEDSQAAADSDEEEPELPEVMGGTVQIA